MRVCGQDVGKEQTVQLLQKILRAGIIECVHSSSSGSQNREVLKYRASNSLAEVFYTTNTGH